MSQLRPGMVLGKALHTPSGDVLLGAGTVLTPFYIKRMHERGFVSVYLRDGLGDDVEPRGIVSDEVRAATVTHLARAFSSIGSIAQDHQADGPKRPRTVDQAVARLGERPLAMPSDGLAAVQALYDDIERLLQEILESNTVGALESLKTHNDYTFQHSVDVAVLGILLGKTAGLPREQLRELALGCLLHDIGKMYIDEAILDKPGSLDPLELDEIKKHPLMGFELVRRMPVFSILPAHVAYQHHERQDGGGYPRGLVGANRVSRSAAERIDPKRMLLIAEIAAVADVYSALTSDRPYRPAMALDRSAATVREMAGPHLNRDVVELLMRTLPAFPVGHWVAVADGRYLGWRGIVTRLSPDALHLPTIRLLLDDRGERAAPPVELDLRARNDVRIAGLPPGEVPWEMELLTPIAV